MKYLNKSELWKNYKHLDDDLKEELLTMDENQLKERFEEDLEFGTAGLRGLIGVGTNRMNKYVVSRATLGFANYLLKFDNALGRGITIAYDNRNKSSEFALDCANVLMALGFKVYLYSELRPTPQLSFTIRHFNCVAGIMITASHNPKEYNGFKIYNETGCQCLPSEVSQIVKNINKIESYFNISKQYVDELITHLGEELDDIYLEKVKEITLNKDLNKDFKVVYSPLHGTGLVYIAKLLKEAGYNVVTVDSQMTNDPNFSCALSTNPEEFVAHLEALNLAKETEAKMTLLTDPDADRVAVTIFHDGEYKLLSGNEIATLLVYYILETNSKQETLDENSYVFSSIVSSPLPLKIAKIYKVKTDVLLTGFKYIGEKIENLKGTDDSFIFGYEESIGYLIKDFVRDKDAVQTSLLLCEVAAYYHNLNMTLIDALETIYKSYGYYKEKTINITLDGIEGSQRLKQIMAYFRENEIALPSFKIQAKNDYQTRVINNYLTNQTSESTLPTSNVIKYFLNDDAWFVLRPSGTEPKLKVYLGVKTNSSEDSINLLAKLEEEVSQIIANI